MRLRPAHPEARYYLGLTLKGKAVSRTRSGSCAAAARDGPALSLVHLHLGVALQQAGDAEGAVEHLKTAVRSIPASADAQNSLGLAFMHARRRRGCGRDVPGPGRARAREPDRAHQPRDGADAAWRARRRCHGPQGGHRAQPKNAEARYNLGLALKQQDEFAARRDRVA